MTESSWVLVYKNHIWLLQADNVSRSLTNNILIQRNVINEDLFIFFVICFAFHVLLPIMANNDVRKVNSCILPSLFNSEFPHSTYVMYFMTLNFAFKPCQQYSALKFLVHDRNGIQAVNKPLQEAPKVYLETVTTTGNYTLKYITTTDTAIPLNYGSTCSVVRSWLSGQQRPCGNSALVCITAIW